MSDSPSAPEPAANTRRRAILLILVALAVIASIVIWWRGHNIESTDDAYIQADITMIAPRVSGTVLKVLVEDNQTVSAGDVLVEIDPADYSASLREAEANLAATTAELESARADEAVTRKSAPAAEAQAAAALRAAQAQSDRAQADVQRYQMLFDKDEISHQTLDQALSTAKAQVAEVARAQAALQGAQTADEQQTLRRARVMSAEAAVAQAQAALDQARLRLSYTRITAPSAGFVTRKNVQPGSQVQVGSPVLAIVGGTPWVQANFKETQLERLHVGQPVVIKVDAYPATVFGGRVDSLQAGTGSAFSLLPPENATGNFVKVVQRVPIKIVFDTAPDPALHLVPGMSVVPKVNVAPSVASGSGAAP